MYIEFKNLYEVPFLLIFMMRLISNKKFVRINMNN